MSSVKLKDDISNEELMKIIIKDLEKAKQNQKKNIDIMASKKFNYGDIVIKSGANRLDGMFGIDKNEIGVIVGCYEIDGITESFGDYRKMYRVHYNNRNNYVGVQEDNIKLYEGEIPEHLKNVTWNQIYYHGIS